MDAVEEVIKKIDGKYYVFSEDGKKLSKGYDTRAAAAKRLGQIEHFKRESLVWEVQDFKTEIKESEQDGKKTKWLSMTGTALEVGQSKNKINYKIKNLQENDGKSFNFIVAHREDYDNPDHNVGEGSYTLNGEKLSFGGKVKNTHHHPDIIEQIQDGLVAPSIHGGYENMKTDESGVHISGLNIPLVALVNKHARGVVAANIEAAIMERMQEAEKFKPPEAGDAPAKVRSILAKAYTSSRSRGIDKERSAKMAWGAVKKAGFKKNEEGRWVKVKEGTEVSKMEKEDIVLENEELKKENEEAKVKLKEMEEKFTLSEKEHIVESILAVNKELKKEELIKESEDSLKTVLKYENKIKEQEEAKDKSPNEKEEKDGEEEVETKEESEEAGAEVKEEKSEETKEKDKLKGIIVEKGGRISMNKERYAKFNEEMLNSIYR